GNEFSMTRGQRRLNNYSPCSAIRSLKKERKTRNMEPTLAPCADCGTQVSASATACLKCGKRLKSTPINILASLVLGMIAIGFACGIVSAMHGSGPIQEKVTEATGEAAANVLNAGGTVTNVNASGTTTVGPIEYQRGGTVTGSGIPVAQVVPGQ